MGKTNFDELELVTNLANTELACPNSEESIQFAVLGAVSATTNVGAALIGHRGGTITDVRAYALTAPTGQAMIIDIHKNGTTIFTTQANRPTIAAGQNASTNTAPDVTAVAANDRLTLDVDQVGSGEAGANLMVTITLKRAHVA